jgi:hypothetical protein
MPRLTTSQDRGDHCKQIYELFFRLRKEAEEVQNGVDLGKCLENDTEIL